MSEKTPVRLAPAYSWECRCGAKNWEEPWGARNTRTLIRDGHYVTEWAKVPKIVRCRTCGEAFETEGG